MADNELTPMDRQIIGQSKRITIPLGDAFIFRDFADILRGLALELEVASRTTDLPLRGRIFNVAVEIDSCNRRIKERAKQAGLEIREGRPKNSERAEHSRDEVETVSLGHYRNTQHVGR